MKLPLNEHSFDFNETGNVTGTKYDGQFTVLCILSMGQKHALQVERTRLLADAVAPTDELSGMAIILANLRHRIVDAPNWWQQSNGGSTIQDENVLVALYHKVMEAEGVWRQKLKEKAEKADSETPKTDQAPQAQ